VKRRQETTALLVSRTVPAPRDAVFRAWTQPALLERWFWPWSPSATVDLRVGGSYQISAEHPAIGLLRITGRYIEVVVPERLAFTWNWDGEPASAETVVTVTFEARDGATEVVVSHEGFPSAESREQHEQGWSDVLARLPSVVAGASH
jgi:uncharacterized protein YndB with AHSA1/START domain